MKKSFKLYVYVWALLAVLFNVVAFVLPAYEKFSPTFWIGLVFVNVAFIGHILCSFVSFKGDNLKKVFYNISLVSISYSGLVSTFAVGFICILVPAIPYWISAVICTLFLICNIIAVVKASVAVSMVADVDEKVQTATSFIYDMRVESETLIARVQNDDLKAVCKKVSDEFKYSDPMSCSELADDEGEIGNFFGVFARAVMSNNAEEAARSSSVLISLIQKRNNKCKRLK